MDDRDLSIGLVYDLRRDYEGLGLGEEELAEFDSPATIEALEGALRANGHRPERVGNLRHLMEALAEGQRWDLVFNIAEGRFGVGREAQVPALLDAFEIAYTFSDPLVSCATLHKATAKRLLRDQGLPTPAFRLVSDLRDLDGLDLRYPLFAKPVAEGTSKGVDARSRVRDEGELRERCTRLLAQYRQEVLVEEYLPGRELTVGLVGTGADAWAVGALEVTTLDPRDEGIYTYVGKEDCETRVRYTLAEDDLGREAKDLALRAWRALGCRDAGRVDVRCDAQGRLSVIELNPLAGMHPSHSDLPILWQLTGRRYQDLVGAIVDSAARRIVRREGATVPCAS